MAQEPLIESLFPTRKTQERAITIWLLRIEGLTQDEIKDKLKISRTTVWKYLKKIKEAGAVLSYEGINEMKQTYKDRKELLIRKAFKELSKAERTGDKVKIIKTLSSLIDTEADAFWRTHKEEPITPESPLSMTRAWIHEAEEKLKEDANVK